MFLEENVVLDSHDEYMNKIYGHKFSMVLFFPEVNSE